MQVEYSPLPLFPLDSGVGYFTPRQELPARVKVSDPAMLVMTDLRQVAAVTIEPNTALDSALQKMIERGVRLLLVTASQQNVLGLISAADIQGERPMRFLKTVGVRYDDILVRDIMTAREDLAILRYDAVLEAQVGAIVATLKSTGCQHVLVVDTDVETMRPAVRGIFSASQLSRQLGTPIYAANALSSLAALRLALTG